MNRLALGVAAGLLVLSIAFWAGCGAERDRWQHALDHAHAQHVGDSVRIELLRADSGRIEVIYRVDTIRLTRLVSRLDTVRDTLLRHLTDTIRIKEYIAGVDSVVGACQALRVSCEAKAANAESRAAALARSNEGLLRELGKPKPRWPQVKIAVVGVVVGGAVLCAVTSCWKRKG